MPRPACVSARSFAAALFLAPALLAQTASTGALTGTIHDPTGAVIANATVLLTNTGTNQGRTVEISNTADKYYAKRENEPAIYELDTKAAQDLIKGAADIKPSAPPKKK